MTKESNEELFAKYCMEEDPVKKEIIRERFFEQNKKYPHYFARRFLNQLEYDEAISCSQLGLIKAFNSFSLDKNIKFATYASRIIMNEILMELRKITRRGNPVSLDGAASKGKDGNDLFLSTIIEDNRQSVITTVTESEIIRSIKEEFMPLLSDREQGILKAHLKDDPPTQRELAERYNITQSYVSRLTQTIFEKAYYFLQTGKIKECVTMANNQRVKQTITIPEGTVLEQVRFMRKNFPDLKPKEIAQKLGKSTGTISTYLSQIRREEEKSTQNLKRKEKELDENMMKKFINIPGNTLVEKIDYIRKDNPNFTVEQIAEALGSQPDSIRYYIKSIKEPKNTNEAQTEELIKPETKEETKVKKPTLTDKIRSVLMVHPDASISYLVVELGVDRALIEKFYPEESMSTHQEPPADTNVEEESDKLSPVPQVATPSATDTKSKDEDNGLKPVPQVITTSTTDAEIIINPASKFEGIKGMLEVSTASKEIASTTIMRTPSELQHNIKKEVNEIIQSHKHHGIMDSEYLSKSDDSSEPAQTPSINFEESYTNQNVKGENKMTVPSQTETTIEPSTSMISLQLEDTNKDALQIMLNGVAAILQNGEVYDLTISVKKKGE